MNRDERPTLHARTWLAIMGRLWRTGQSGTVALMRMESAARADLDEATRRAVHA